MYAYLIYSPLISTIFIEFQGVIKKQCSVEFPAISYARSYNPSLSIDLNFGDCKTYDPNQMHYIWQTMNEENVV